MELGQTESELQKHIGRHIQNFSLYAFLDPNEDDGDGNDSRTRTITAQRSGSNLSSIALEFNDDVDEPEGKALELADDHYIREDYGTHLTPSPQPHSDQYQPPQSNSNRKVSHLMAETNH